MMSATLRKVVFRFPALVTFALCSLATVHVAATPEMARLAGASEEGQELPAGHPPVGDSSMDPAGPVTDAADLLAGQLEVLILDGTGSFVANHKIELVRWAPGANQGAPPSPLGALSTDTHGRATFVVAEQQREGIFRVVTEYQGLSYASVPVTMDAKNGKRLKLSVYTTTKDIDEALVGVQAFMFIQPGDHGLQVDQLFRYSNLGAKTWEAQQHAFLPPHASAIQVPEASSSLVVKAEGTKLEIAGLVAPGQSEVTVTYQVPYSGQGSEVLNLRLPARVAHVRVITTASSQTKLRVEGMPAPQLEQSQQGGNLSVVERELTAGEPQIESLRVIFEGTPQDSWIPWLVLVGALGFVSAGIGMSLSRTGARTSTTTDPSALAHAIAQLDVQLKQEPSEALQSQRDDLIRALAKILQLSESRAKL